MKKIVGIIFAFCLMLLVSCDYVKNAKESYSGNPSGPQNGQVYRKVIVEDYTGHKCGNCPPAAAELKRIDSIYNGKIIPIAVHAGFYAQTNAQYPTNFNTVDGTIYDNTFGVSVAGNPNGLVNRSGWNTSNFIRAWSSWETVAAPVTSELADFSIHMTSSYNSTSNQVSSTVSVKALNALSGTFNLSIVLVEDSIIAEQLDYSLPVGQQFISNYEFSHVLRGAVNSTWGEEIFNGSISANDSVVKTYNNFQLSSSFNPSKCHLVAFVYNADNSSSRYYEIYQAEEVHVIP